MARPVFYSFHYDNDVFRVQQVRNIGALEDNAPVSPSGWEAVKRGGDTAIERWIDENMKYRQCVIVLIGSATATRRWVQYEIAKAWNDGKGLFGIYIHNLKCPKVGTCRKGTNPFDTVTFTGTANKLSNAITCYDPGPLPYTKIKENMEYWVEAAIAEAKARK